MRWKRANTILFVTLAAKNRYPKHFIINAWNVNSKTHSHTHTQHSDYIIQFCCCSSFAWTILFASVTAVSGAAWIIYIWIVHLFHSIWMAKTTNTANGAKLKFHSRSCARKCVSRCVCGCSYDERKYPTIARVNSFKFYDTLESHSAFATIICCHECTVRVWAMLLSSFLSCIKTCNSRIHFDGTLWIYLSFSFFRRCASVSECVCVRASLHIFSGKRHPYSSFETANAQHAYDVIAKNRDFQLNMSNKQISYVRPYRC